MLVYLGWYNASKSATFHRLDTKQVKTELLEVVHAHWHSSGYYTRLLHVLGPEIQ